MPQDTVSRQPMKATSMGGKCPGKNLSWSFDLADRTPRTAASRCSCRVEAELEMASSRLGGVLSTSSPLSRHLELLFESAAPPPRKQAQTLHQNPICTLPPPGADRLLTLTLALCTKLYARFTCMQFPKKLKTSHGLHSWLTRQRQTKAQTQP